VLRLSCTDLPKVGLLAIDCERRTESRLPLGGWPRTQSSCLFRQLLSRCSNRTPQTREGHACLIIPSHSLGFPLGKLVSYFYLMFPAWLLLHSLSLNAQLLIYLALIDTPRHDSKRFCGYHSIVARTLRQPYPTRRRDFPACTGCCSEYSRSAVAHTVTISVAHIHDEQRNYDHTLRANSSFTADNLYPDRSVDAPDHHPSFSAAI